MLTCYAGPRRHCGMGVKCSCHGSRRLRCLFPVLPLGMEHLPLALPHLTALSYPCLPGLPASSSAARALPPPGCYPLAPVLSATGHRSSNPYCTTLPFPLPAVPPPAASAHRYLVVPHTSRHSTSSPLIPMPTLHARQAMPALAVPAL